MNIASLLTKINISLALKAINNDLILYILVLINAILAAALEEIINRGIFQTYLINRFSINKGILIQSIIFTLPHIANYIYMGLSVYVIYQLYFVFLTGLILGVIYYRTKSIIYPIVLHFLINYSVNILDFFTRISN